MNLLYADLGEVAYHVIDLGGNRRPLGCKQHIAMARLRELISAATFALDASWPSLHGDDVQLSLLSPCRLANIGEAYSGELGSGRRERRMS